MKKKAFLSLIPVLGLSFCLPVLAGEPEFTLEEMVVTATKTSLSTKKVASDVSVITKEDIKERNAHYLKEIIDSLPGVAVNRSGNRRSASIRGFESRYVVILIDGQRFPSEPDATYELDRISLDNVERIEVVRGSGSALYGADALGGVINIITKRPGTSKTTLYTEGSLLGATGDSNHSYGVNFDSGLQGKTSFTLSAGQSKNDAFYKENGTTFFPFGTRTHLDANLEYRPNDEETWKMGGSYLKEKTNEYGTLQGMGGYTILTDLIEDNQRQRYNLSYQKHKGEKELFINGYHSIWEKYNDTINRLTGLYTNNIFGYTTLSGLEVRQSQKSGENHRITWGGEYRHELYRGTGIKSGNGTFTKILHGTAYTGSDVDSDYGALYAQDEWSLSPKLLVVSSLRWDESNRFESNLSPKIGATYELNDHLRFKLNAGSGFRVPSPNQLYLNLNVLRNGALVNLLGNDKLQPEKSFFYDVSVEKEWGNTSAKITYFASQVKDMIDEVWLSTNKIQYQNIDKAKIQGVEVSIQSTLNKKTKWSANYTYLDAVDDQTQNRLYNRARNKISSQLSYQPTSDFKATLWVDAYLSYYFQPSAYISSERNYVLWNLNLEKKLAKNQTVFVGVENLFNHRDDDLSIPGTIFQLGYKVEI